MKIIQLIYPPPLNCQLCKKPKDLFATRAGWLCWVCVSPEDKVDGFGIKYPEPEVTKRDRRDLREIRARLAGEPLPKRAGRPSNFRAIS